MTQGLKAKVRENVKESNNRKPPTSWGDFGVFGSSSRPTTVDAVEPTCLINSFISEATENAENVLMTQKLETAQTIKSPHIQEPPQSTGSAYTGVRANAEKAMARICKHSPYACKIAEKVGKHKLPNWPDPCLLYKTNLMRQLASKLPEINTNFM